MTVAIRARRLHRRYGTVTAVDGIDLDVRRGSSVALVGGPQSGRTTLMLMIAGLLPPSGGELVVGDVDVIVNPRAARVQAGYAGARPVGGNGLSVRDYLRFLAASPRAQHLPADAADLAAARLEAGADASIDALTTAERRWLAVAAVLMLRPPVILLDEPFGGSDKPGRVLEWMSERRRDGTTFIIAASNAADVAGVTDTALHLHGGRIVRTVSAAAATACATAAVFAGAL